MLNELSPKLAEEVLQEYLKILAGWLFVSKSTGRARISSPCDSLIRQERVKDAGAGTGRAEFGVAMGLRDWLLLTA